MNVEISNFVKEQLEDLKEQEGHKSLDSVIRVLLVERKKGTQG